MNYSHINLLNDQSISYLRENLFPIIYARNAILFLGAGASIGDKKYLSKDIINYHRVLTGVEFDESDITKYVDVLSCQPDFDRNDFDDYISQILRKLKPTSTHLDMLSIPWKEIITSNFDLLVERAYDQIIDTDKENLELKQIKSFEEYQYVPSNNELRYIKLNGCISDNRKYKLIISRKDFEEVKNYHRAVIKSLLNTSHKVVLITAGYSFNDKFADQLFNYFEQYKITKNKPIYRIDPNIPDALLRYYDDQGFFIIKIKFDEFISEFVKWFEDMNINKRRHLEIRDNNNCYINLSKSSVMNLADSIEQLTEYYKGDHISAKEFYRGKEPNLSVILNNYDIASEIEIKNIHNKFDLLTEKDNSIIPIVFITGRYGIGKSTLLYRSIYEYISKDKRQAFELIHPDKIKMFAVTELINKSKADNIIFLFEHIEVDSAFKALQKFRHDLSLEQINRCKIIIVSSIRENILEKYIRSKNLAQVYLVSLNPELSADQASQLVDKLEKAELIRVRDHRSKKNIVQEAIKNNDRDMFVFLLRVLNSEHHINTIYNAFSQLSEQTKEAVLYTSMLYRFSILMPSTLLKKLLGLSWEDFISKIIKYDSKGILIQSETPSSGIEPDIYFHTPHPLLAEKLISIKYNNEDARFNKYKEIIKKIDIGQTSSKLIIDLLKALKVNEDLSISKINKLYDSCSQEFYSDVHFVIHYSLNLESRNDEESLKNALDKVIYVSSLLDTRNHYLIHRRAVLNYAMAKLIYQKENELAKTYEYIAEAREFFKIKLIMDPFSSYSYKSFIDMELWILKNAQLTKLEQLRQINLIEDLLIQGEEKTFENISQLTELRNSFSKIISSEYGYNEENILYKLEKMKEDSELFPYALVTEYYYYEDKKDYNQLSQTIFVLEKYSYIDEVVKVLFKYYAKNLHLHEYRIKYQQILNENKMLEKLYPVMSLYYSYISEAYKHHFQLSKEHLQNLRSNYKYLNPLLNEVWKNENTGEAEIFEGIVKKNKNDYIKVKIVDLNQTFGLKKTCSQETILEHNSKHKFTLSFYLTGIRAELVEK